MLQDILGVLIPWLISAGILTGVVLAVLFGHWLLYRLLDDLASHTPSTLDDSFVRHSRRPAKLILPLLAVVATLPALPLPHTVTGPARHIAGLGLIASAAWLLIALLSVVDDAVALKFPVDVKDNLSARRVQTQVRVLQRIVVVVVAIVTTSIMLMTFPSIRQLGTSLLASAGLAGLIVGLAARSTLQNLLAGVQVALTEPIRIDDVVIVEGEWGRIEEIRTSYVVVKIWDLRRLVVPISYFIEKPFQNWTRTTAALMGTVFLYVDYTVPVEAVRQELCRILEESRDKWDGQVCVLQVTDSKEQTLELRALMSAADSGTAWDLRCQVRERLVEFLQKNYPQCLPRMRAEIREPAGPASLAPGRAAQAAS
ncbi:MAG TPA: mechanosensitive ion channel domain-containing protein [Candidatus Dormibacteraeota bacterium]|nr:mechanosensitive ion channel domain-containing protein [Candidatus Dormibacteraeota bacterium]